MIIQGNDICIANVGDCKGIVAKCQMDQERWIKQMDFVKLTQDHTLDNEEEVSRIKSEGGNIVRTNSFSETDKALIQFQNRVLKDVTCSRSFGDSIARQAGVTNEITVNNYQLKSEDFFIVLANPGVWKNMNDH